MAKIIFLTSRLEDGITKILATKIIFIPIFGNSIVELIRWLLKNTKIRNIKNYEINFVFLGWVSGVFIRKTYPMVNVLDPR